VAQIQPRETCIRCLKPLPVNRWFQCETCDEWNKGRLEERLERERNEDLQRRLKQSNLPKIYQRGIRTWDHVAGRIGGGTEAIAQLLSRGTGLYLWGEAGAFKTSFAAARLAMEIWNGRSGRYVFLPNLFTELYDIYAAQDQRSRADVVERYALTPMLVLDDLGKEKPTEHGAAVLLEILDYRYRNGLTWLIVTSNYSQPELAARLETGAGETFAEPIMRRLSEMTVNVPMEVPEKRAEILGDGRAVDVTPTQAEEK
jgi:DNA replication protein DnaC